MWDLFVFSIIGIFLGSVAGLLPGIHPNQFFLLVVSFLPFLSSFPTETILALIINIMVSNILFNYIPAIFFSVPDPNTVLNILPGHRMVLDGRGLDALFISLCGVLLTTLFSIILLPLLLILIPILNTFVYPYLHVLLILLSLWMIYLEGDWKKRFLSLFLYIISGVWGILCLNSKIIDSEVVLFPALTGMFGLAGILTSIKENTKFPNQKYVGDVKIGNASKIVLWALIAGVLIGVLPGAGESQAGVLVSNITGLGQNEFLGALAGINVSNAIFALVSLYSFGKVRSGSAAAVEAILPKFTLGYLIFSAGMIAISCGISAILVWVTGKKLLKFLERLNYKLVSKIIFIFTVMMVFIFSGLIGVFVLFVSTCLGVLPIFWDIKRTSNMGFLMVSTIIYFSGLTWVLNSILF